MTRDEAIEAGARAIQRAMFPILDYSDTHPVGAGWRDIAAAVLDAVGWAEPVGYVVALDGGDRPGYIYGAAWPDLDSAHQWVELDERIWGLVPVEGAIELDANEGGRA